MLEIVYRNIDGLVPYARNSRTHTEEQIKQIARSIIEFGFTNPVLVDETGGIIAGHGRVLASELMNLTEIPTIIIEGLTEAQKIAYVVADNKIALNAGWDEEMLQSELDLLLEMDFDIEIAGFEVEMDRGFEPTLDPSSNKSDVTDEDMAKKESDLESFNSMDKKRETVVCPNCYHEFEIND